MKRVPQSRFPTQAPLPRPPDRRALTDIQAELARFERLFCDTRLIDCRVEREFLVERAA
jgi:hypothetical protein